MPGFRRSRVLWDEARRPGAPMMSVIRAILYELQPIRFKSIDTLLWRVRGQLWIQGLFKFVTQTVPSIVRTVITFIRSLSTKTWTRILAGLLYYVALRVIHSFLDAGPLVMILTALGVILTVGLGDDDPNDLHNPHRVSAYSVFNRGFHRLMGSIDVEDLVNQHVGGGGGMLGVAAATSAYGGGGGSYDDIDAAGTSSSSSRMDRSDSHGPSRAHRRRRDAPAVASTAITTADTTRIQEESTEGGRRRRRELEQRLELQRQRRIAMERGLG